MKNLKQENKRPKPVSSRRKISNSSPLYFRILIYSNFLSVICNFRILSSAGKNLTENFLIELAKREEANRSGKMTVIYSHIDN